MTRTQKIQKLANAIKDYRGSYNENTGQWFRPPKATAIARVVNWLERLNIPVQESVEKVHNFHNVKEFNEWIRTL